MQSRVLEDPVGFMAEHGGMHSAAITGYAWEAEAARLKIRVDDLDSDLVGIPGYGGERPVELVFDGVSALKSDRDNFNDLVIHDLEIIPQRKHLVLHLICRPDGFLHCRCDRISMNE